MTVVDRTRLEVALPGFAVGFVAGSVAGVMAAIVGQPLGWAVLAALTLGLPLGLLGAGYSLLLAGGHVRVGGFAPACLYWLAGFPVSRLIQEVTTRLVLTGKPGLPPDVLGFLAYQGIISAGFAIGFLWLHERLAPQWWRRMSEHNPVAARVYERYAVHAHAMRSARVRRREGSRTR
jgi:hypothetical protein